MPKRRSRFAPAIAPIGEALEGRVVLSTVGPAPGTIMEVAPPSVHKAATTTTLAVQAGTLGQPVTFTATVRAPASSGAPAGTVDLVDHGQVFQTLTLSPSTVPGSRYATSQASYTFTPQPGGGSFSFGKHAVTAQFTPAGGFSRSVATKAFTVGQPTYTTLADGVKVATIVPGSGPSIASGQTAHVLYTGYLAKTGQIFDESASHGGTTLSFTLGAGQVVPGFDAGATAMRAGETRIIEIPPAQGYGATANGPIPANSTLLFVMTLESIS